MVVETIDFFDDEDAELPAPLTLKDVIAMNKVRLRGLWRDKAGRQRAVQQGACGSHLGLRLRDRRVRQGPHAYHAQRSSQCTVYGGPAAARTAAVLQERVASLPPHLRLATHPWQPLPAPLWPTSSPSSLCLCTCCVQAREYEQSGQGREDAEAAAAQDPAAAAQAAEVSLLARGVGRMCHRAASIVCLCAYLHKHVQLCRGNLRLPYCVLAVMPCPYARQRSTCHVQ